MFKKGTKFEVVKNGIVGVIGDSFFMGDVHRCYAVTFYEGDRIYYCCPFFEDTIKSHVKSGIYKIIEEV